MCCVESSDQQLVHHPVKMPGAKVRSCISLYPFIKCHCYNAANKAIDRLLLISPLFMLLQIRVTTSGVWLISVLPLFQQEMWAVSVLAGHGYTPQPSDLEQLIDIDSKMRLLLPAEESLSVQSSYTNFNISRVCIQQHQTAGLAMCFDRGAVQGCSERPLSLIATSTQLSIDGHIL